MQKLDIATLRELAWRDFLLWPLVRPAGVAYGFASRASLAVLAFLLGVDGEYVERHILTLANLISAYGIFLWIELVYLIVAWYRGSESVVILAGGAFFTDFSIPTIRVIALLVVEIWITDLIDGPMARVNNAVTALGTLMDHLRDYLTAFTALFFLIVVTVSSGQLPIFMLECAAVGGFLLVMLYHQKL